MTTRYLFIAVFAAWAISTHADHAIPGSIGHHRAQDNHAPVVKIQSPAPHTTVTRGTPVPYEITVTDKEDGDSRYDEINPKEVVLMIRTADASQSTAATSQSTAPKGPADPLKAPGLAIMARSNCFNCHQFNGKLIGPSLADIARRYQNITATTDTLVKRIRDGSAGIWGKEKMPSHPELSMDDIRAMVHWIEKYAAAPGITYQNGTSGVLQLLASGPSPAGAPGSTAARPGIYTLTAAYTDHGTKDTRTGPYLTGLDQLTLTVK